jgi:hypothetical protein
MRRPKCRASIAAAVAGCALVGILAAPSFARMGRQHVYAPARNVPRHEYTPARSWLQPVLTPARTGQPHVFTPARTGQRHVFAPARRIPHEWSEDLGDLVWRMRF